MQADVTQMLLQWSAGDQEALHRLLPLLYDQLKQLAHDRLRRDGAGHTLNTTGLVHECYLRLVDITRIEWRDRAHFLAMASRTMRRILIDYARSQKARKRGSGTPKDEFIDDRFIPPSQAETLLELDDAVRRLESDHPRRGKAVELRYFGGLTLAETATVLGISPATVMRDVRFGEAWLAREWKGARKWNRGDDGKSMGEGTSMGEGNSEGEGNSGGEGNSEGEGNSGGEGKGRMRELS